jgi:RHS repeat-associated protein
VHQATNTTRTYNYPAAGGGAGSKPHVVTSVTSTGGSTATLHYAYDASGNTLCRPAGSVPNVCGADGTAGAESQALSWNDEGRLSNSTDKTGDTSYTYDADGNRLIRRDPAGATLYLPGGLEIRKPKTGAAVGTHYYSHAGSTIAVRTPTSLTWLVNDHQGTATATVSSDKNLTVNRRRTLPFGEDRGPKPAAWAGDKGFVGGTRDNTGLTHLGAREYDPFLGRFTSVDPLMDLSDPQQWSAYNYSDDSPISSADPTGLMLDCGTGTAWVSCGASNYNNTGGKGGPSGGPGSKGGSTGSSGSTGGGNYASAAPSGNVVEAVPASGQEDKCGWFAPVCDGWQRSMEWIHENQDTLGHIAIDLAEIGLGGYAIQTGGPLVVAGGVVEIGSFGTATVIAVPAAALGVVAVAGGGVAVLQGSNNLRRTSTSCIGTTRPQAPGPRPDRRETLREQESSRLETPQTQGAPSPISTTSRMACYGRRRVRPGQVTTKIGSTST